MRLEKCQIGQKLVRLTSVGQLSVAQNSCQLLLSLIPNVQKYLILFLIFVLSIYFLNLFVYHVELSVKMCQTIVLITLMLVLKKKKKHLWNY